MCIRDRLYPTCEAFYFQNCGKLFLAEDVRSPQIEGPDRFIRFGVNVRFFNIEGKMCIRDRPISWWLCWARRKNCWNEVSCSPRRWQCAFFTYVPVDWTGNSELYQEYCRLMALYNEYPAIRKGGLKT